MSIPIFSGRLEEARSSTDAANLRAAKAAGVNYYITDKKITGTQMYYDIDEGTLVGWNSLPEAGYNKADQGSVSAGTGVIEVNYTAPTSSEEAKVTAKWVKGK